MTLTAFEVAKGLAKKPTLAGIATLQVEPYGDRVTAAKGIVDALERVIFQLQRRGMGIGIEVTQRSDVG